MSLITNAESFLENYYEMFELLTFYRLIKTKTIGDLITWNYWEYNLTEELLNETKQSLIKFYKEMIEYMDKPNSFFSELKIELEELKGLIEA